MSKNQSKTVYVTVTTRGNDIRLRADLPEGGDQVLVGIANGDTIGWYNLDRFEGRRLTARTLRELFTAKAAA